MADNTAIVFGGSGFLGSHVADALTQAGYRVRIFDRAPSPWLQPGQEMITGDIMDLEQVRAAADGADLVLNFAAIADIDEAHDRPVDTAAVNVLGNVHVLEAAREAGARRFVFASSVYVYSNSGSFYRASKQASERFIETYHERYGLDYTILRYGSLYGRRADRRNGIFRMLQEAMETGRITYSGDPEAIREYIHASDAAQLTVKVMADSEYANRHLVLTGQERLRVQDVMRMIAEMLPHEVELQFARPDTLSHYVVTPYAFQPRLGHKLVPSDHVDLGQGLLDCMSALHEDRHDAPDSAARSYPEGSGE